MRNRLLLPLALTLLPAMAFAGEPKRSELEVPPGLWEDVRDAVGHRGRRLGYTSAEMAHYGGCAHVLPAVERLFRDITEVPRATGGWSDRLLSAPDPGSVATKSEPMSLAGVTCPLAACPASRALTIARDAVTVMS